MRNNRQTKVKLIMMCVRCMMKHSKTNELKPMNFDSGNPIFNALIKYRYC